MYFFFYIVTEKSILPAFTLFSSYLTFRQFFEIFEWKYTNELKKKVRLSCDSNPVPIVLQIGVPECFTTYWQPSACIQSVRKLCSYILRNDSSNIWKKFPWTYVRKYLLRAVWPFEYSFQKLVLICCMSWTFWLEFFVFIIILLFF